MTKVVPEAAFAQRRSSKLGRLENRLTVLEALISRVSMTLPASAGSPFSGATAHPDEETVSKSTDVKLLEAKLRDARASEAAAHRFARSARRALRSRKEELGRQALELEQLAESARTEVTRLAADAIKYAEVEHEAYQAYEQARLRLDSLLRYEQKLLEPRQDLKHVLSLGAARRLSRQARTYKALVAKTSEAAVAIHEAQRLYEAAQAARRDIERIALAAEPRASELASAAVVLRAEFDLAEELLSTLPTTAVDDADLSADPYTHWADLYDTITDFDRRAIRARLLRLDYTPLISIVMPVYNPPLNFLRHAVASVQAQLYPNWELCLADDASPNPAVVELLQDFSDNDSRIKLLKRDSNGHISASSNSALSLATGEFVALMDHDDLIPEHALFEVVVCLNDNRDLDLIYSDEDHIDQYGIRNTPYFKTDYNQELLLGHNLISHLGVYRRSLLEQIGGFRLGFEGSQDYDLALRMIDASSPERIHHIPAVLYHWRSNTDEASFSESAMERCIQSARRALTDHLERRGQKGEVIANPLVPSWQRVRRVRPEPAPLVSVIIPTKDKPEFLGPCIEGLLKRTAYPNLEIIIVDHQSTDPSTLDLLAELVRDPRVSVLPHQGIFNYSAINNAAVARARGSVLAFLNNDIDVIDSDWLDEMVSLVVLPDVGAVGAKLFYPDGRVQHGGVVLGLGGVAGHRFHLLDGPDPGYFGLAAMTSDVAAVTAACLVVRKSVFDEVKGFDEPNLAVAFNDIDLCLKIGHAGYRNIWTPHARLRHHESISRGLDRDGEGLERFNREIEFMMQKWGDVLSTDPFYSLNFSLASSSDFKFAFPSRRRKPWYVSGIET